MRCFTFPTLTSCGGFGKFFWYNSKVLKWLTTQLLRIVVVILQAMKIWCLSALTPFLIAANMPIKTSFMKCFILYFLRARVSTWNFSWKRQVNHVNCYRTRGLMSFNEAPAKYKKDSCCRYGCEVPKKKVIKNLMSKWKLAVWALKNDNQNLQS